MRMHQVAAVAAVVGLGLVAVGCGPEPSPSTPMDSAKMKEMYGGSQQPRPGSEPTSAQSPKGDDLSAKVKALEAKTTEDLKPLEKAWAGLGEKIKTAGGDVSKMEPLAKAQKEANVEINDVKEQLKALSGVKEQAALDAADKKIKESMGKLQEILKPYLN